MANPFRNMAAGALDLAYSPIDLLGFAAGAYSGTKSLLSGDGFWQGFSENPFIQFNNSAHKGITNLTGADDESLVREITGAADILWGQGLVKSGIKAHAKRKLAKKFSKSATGKRILDQPKYQWLKDSLKENTSWDNLSSAFGDYAIGNAALGLITPGEGENDKFWRGAALGTLGKRGLKRLKNFKTKTDLSQMTEEEKFKYVTDKFLARDLADSRRISWVDAQGGAVDKYVHNRTFNEDLAIELKKTATDRANAMPQMEELAGIINDFKGKDAKWYEKFNRMSDLQATLGARVGGIRQWLNNIDNIIADNIEDDDKIKVILDGLKAIGMEDTAKRKTFLGALDSKNNVSEMFEFVMPLLEKFPEAGAKGLDNISNQKLLGDFKALQKELGATEFMNTKMKTLSKQVVDMYEQNGMISTKDAIRYRSDIDKGVYVPMKSDAERSLKEVYKSSNPMKNKRRDLADETLSELFNGVNEPGNALNVFAGKIKSELEALQRNIVIRENLPSLNFAMKKRLESLDETILKAKRMGLPEEAKKLEEYKKRFGEVHFDAFTSDDVIARMNERHIPRELAMQDLEKKYLEKGLYKLKSYKKEITKEGVRSVETYSFVPKDFQYIFEQRAVNASTMAKVLVACNHMFTGTISGKWNPFFLAKRIWYGINEMAPALRTELANQGIDVGTWDIMKLYWSSLEDSFRHNYAQMMLDAMDDNVILGKMARGSREGYEKRLDDILNRTQDLNMIRNDVVGEAMKGSPNAININMMRTPTDKLMQAASTAWNWVDQSSLGRVLDLLKNSVDDASQRTILKAIDKYGLKDKPILSKSGTVLSKTGGDKQLVENIVKKMSDTRRRGSGDTMLGMFFNAVQDFMPYGASSLQGLVGKFEYLPKDMTTKAKEYISRAYKANNASVVDTGLDVMAKLGTEMAKLPDNVVFDTLWKTIAIPATLCYMWNYGNDENARYYNSLKPYERSNKFQLVNFFGPGKNLTVPLDQEWSILKNVFDAMLERSFGLSDAHDSGNPAFSMKDQLLWSLGQDFGISLPVAVEAGINALGYKTNLDLGAALQGEAPIQEINPNRFHVLDDGIATAIMQMTGKLGKILVNFAEDKPVMDYRYAVPFLQINPKQKVTSDTVSWLNQQLKLNPTPELQKWSRQRQYIMSEMKFYERNGCTKSGKVIGDRRTVMKQYQKQLDDITRRVYDKTQERYAQAPVLSGQALSGSDDMNQVFPEPGDQLANQ